MMDVKTLRIALLKSLIAMMAMAGMLFHQHNRIERLEAAVFMTDPELEALQK